jgi:hypothetical protein
LCLILDIKRIKYLAHILFDWALEVVLHLLASNRSAYRLKRKWLKAKNMANLNKKGKFNSPRRGEYAKIVTHADLLYRRATPRDASNIAGAFRFLWLTNYYTLVRVGCQSVKNSPHGYPQFPRSVIMLLQWRCVIIGGAARDSNPQNRHTTLAN